MPSNESKAPFWCMKEKSQVPAEAQSLDSSFIRERNYLESVFNILSDKERRLPDQARKARLEKVTEVLAEIDKYSLKILTANDVKAINTLAEVCSSIAHGLNFIEEGKEFSCKIYRQGELHEVTYDDTFHQNNMQFLSEKASSLKKGPLENLKGLLLSLVGVLLFVAVCTVTAVPAVISGPIAVGAGIFFAAGGVVSFFESEEDDKNKKLVDSVNHMHKNLSS